MAISSKSTTKQHIRSISFPTRSHPTTLRIQEKLNNIKTSQVSAPLTAKTICNTLSQFNKLYKCIDDLLNLPLTQQALSQYQHDNWVEGLLDGSVRLLDICGNTIDLVSQMKEHLGDVQSCLRRRKADLSIESSIAKFSSFRKKIKKDAKRSISSLKQIENEVGGLQMLLDLDQHVSAVIKVLREVSAMSVSIFESLLVFLSLPVLKSKQTKWSMVSNFMQKGKVPCEGELDTANELQRVDAALSTLCGYASIETEKLQIAQYKLEKAESCVEEIEISLECIFRQLIRTRASFLNIVLTKCYPKQSLHRNPNFSGYFDVFIFRSGLFNELSDSLLYYLCKSAFLDKTLHCGFGLGFGQFWTQQRDRPDRFNYRFRRVKCVDDLLNFPVTEQVSSQHKHEKWVDELLDGLVRLLDSCGNAMDLISQLKEHLGDVRKHSPKTLPNGPLQILDLDQHISTVIGVLINVSAMNISFFQSLLVFLHVPVSKPNPSKWSLISNLIRKGRVASEGRVDNTNDFERVDADLSTLGKYGSSDTEKMQIAEIRMEALEGYVEEIERELECIFRSLIRTRGSFLNIVSH
ncbi:hypothetical protein LguiA_013908 [Lonicera macranthoides]